MPPYFLALVLAGLGESEAAIDELEAAHAQGDTMLRDVFVDESFDALRDHPRSQRLIARMRLPYEPGG